MQRHAETLRRLVELIVPSSSGTNQPVIETALAGVFFQPPNGLFVAVHDLAVEFELFLRLFGQGGDRSFRPFVFRNGLTL
ncbi:MAG: hypothetical protein V2J10_02580 [Wenzhouxiangella sp.]|nr:hypothetical protein [Wenzhouxiangella sp.]